MHLRDQLAGTIPPELLPYLSDHFDVIGDIAVLVVPQELEPFRFAIADAILARRKNILTVMRKTGKISESSRTAAYEILRGAVTVTVYREFGYSYRLDVGSSFFSPRMAYERKRVTDQAEPGEKVFVPFAGVGPFAIPAAARGAEVWAVEKNPEAFRWLTENVDLNRVRKNCHVRQGDALDTSCLSRTSFDRLIIPAPYGMDTALDTLLPLLAYGGMAHFYTFKAKDQVPGLVARYRERGLDVTYYSPCGNVAPGISRWVFDLSRPL